MNFTGRLVGISRDFETSKPVLQLAVNESLYGINDLQDKDLSIKIVRKSQKRSLDANAYFHALCDKLRFKIDSVPWSMARVKNHLIADYGQVMYLEEGAPLIYKTNAPPEYVRELEEPHLHLVKTEFERGKEVYFYRMYRGSHTYNSLEMSKLIDGTIEECKALGIETMTRTQIERMIAAWEAKNGKKEQGASVC